MPPKPLERFRAHSKIGTNGVSNALARLFFQPSQSNILVTLTGVVMVGEKRSLAKQIG